MNEVPIDEAVERKYPEWVGMVVATDDTGNANAMPAGWVMFTSHDPWMMAVSVGFERYTHALLSESEEFVINFPRFDQREAVLYCGTHSGAEVEKFEETDLETAPASSVDVPLIEDSVASFECEKRGSLDTGDHTIFAGEIVGAHVSEEEEKLYHLGTFHDRGVESFTRVVPKDVE